MLEGLDAPAGALVEGEEHGEEDECGGQWDGDGKDLVEAELVNGRGGVHAEEGREERQGAKEDGHDGEDLR